MLGWGRSPARCLRSWDRPDPPQGPCRVRPTHRTCLWGGGPGRGRQRAIGAWSTFQQTSWAGTSEGVPGAGPRVGEGGHRGGGSTQAKTASSQIEAPKSPQDQWTPVPDARGEAGGGPPAQPAPSQPGPDDRGRAGSPRPQTQFPAGPTPQQTTQPSAGTPIVLDIVAEPRNTGVNQKSTKSECCVLRLRKVRRKRPCVVNAIELEEGGAPRSPSQHTPVEQDVSALTPYCKHPALSRQLRRS